MVQGLDYKFRVKRIAMVDGAQIIEHIIQPDVSLLVEGRQQAVASLGQGAAAFQDALEPPCRSPGSR